MRAAGAGGVRGRLLGLGVVCRGAERQVALRREEGFAQVVGEERQVSETQRVKEKFQCQDKRFNFDLVSLRDSK